MTRNLPPIPWYGEEGSHRGNPARSRPSTGERQIGQDTVFQTCMYRRTTDGCPDSCTKGNDRRDKVRNVLSNWIPLALDPDPGIPISGYSVHKENLDVTFP